MIVSGIQFDIAWEDPARNLERAGALLEEAAAAGTRLAVLPEMFATGFSMAPERVVPHAREILAWAAGRARATGMWILSGVAVTEAAGPMNAAVLHDPEGTERIRYHKIHPFSLAGEHLHYRGGDVLPSCEVEGIRVTPLVCYDLRFPEPFRAAAADTDLFAVIANWPERRGEAWRTLLAARATENQAFVLGVNRIGEAEGIAHSGDSALRDPWGACVFSLAGTEGLVSGEVRAEDVAAARERFGFLADRRPDVYRKLERNRPGGETA
ncbi:MAG: nitrilase-related carbon-nitrogen hydrolase [Planctomycetota bacterium]